LLLAAVACGLLFAEASIARELTMNMKDADIEALISTVAEVTGRNFVIDPRVKGKVTVISSTPMDEQQVYQVFLSILKVHGFAAVETGGIIKIVPDTNAKADNVGTVTAGSPGTGDEFVTRVIEVKNVPAAQLVPILRPLVPQQGHLAAYAPSNMLVVSDRAANVERLASIIRRIDLDSSAEIDILPLEYASATEVVRIINRLEPDTKKADAAGSYPRLVADERTNSVLLSGDKAARLHLRTIITHLDTPLESEGNTHVVYLRYANAVDLMAVLEGVSNNITVDQRGGKPARAGQAASSRGEEVSIQADENMNALVITASPAMFRSLQSVIRQLDIRRAQVLVEAIIAEVSSDQTNELGVQWRSTGDLTRNNTGFAGFNSAAAPVPINTEIETSNPLAVLGNGLSIGFIDGLLGTNLNIGALVNALATDGDTNILSTPSLVTLDNEEAEIIVGQNVPFVTGSFTSTGASDSATNPFQTIERQDVGITLRIKPQINEGDSVKLEIFQEVSSVGPRGEASDIQTNKRSIKTSVIVKDGQMLVLGGLMEDDLNESIQKVPLLGDIPLLGNLFRTRKTTLGKTSLMVFLHPVILRDAATEGAISSGKYNYLRARQLDRHARGVNLMPGEEQPLLPELDSLLDQPPPGVEEPGEGTATAP